MEVFCSPTHSSEFQEAGPSTPLRMTEWMGHGASLQNDAGFLLLLLLLLHLLEVDEGDARLWGVLCTLDQHTPVFRNGQLSV